MFLYQNTLNSEDFNIFFIEIKNPISALVHVGQADGYMTFWSEIGLTGLPFVKFHKLADL